MRSRAAPVAIDGLRRQRLWRGRRIAAKAAHMNAAAIASDDGTLAFFQPRLPLRVKLVGQGMGQVNSLFPEFLGNQVEAHALQLSSLHAPIPPAMIGIANGRSARGGEHLLD